MRIESDNSNEVALVAAAQDGCLDSFGALYQRYHNPIVALAYAQLGDRHAAEDAAQEVFAAACHDLGALRDRDKFGAWLGGICRNVTRQMLRTRTRPAPLPTEPRDEEQQADGEHREAVRRAVWKLEPGERELIVMRYFDGFSQARISEVLDITPSAVNGRLVRAKRKVAQWLKRDGFGS
jgi:RNA polymerase sigma-70 factor, ECF subfamily